MTRLNTIPTTPRTPTRPASIITTLLFVLLSGCSSTTSSQRWEDRVLDAGNLSDAHQPEAAEKLYLTLLAEASTPERRRYVLVELGRLAEDRGDAPDALAYFERVWSVPLDDEYGAEALYRTSVIQQRNDDPAYADSRREIILRYPRSVSAEFAARDIAKALGPSGRTDDLAALFRDLYDQLRGEPIGDNLLFELGRTLQASGDHDAALDAYREIFLSYPEDSLADDALWHIAEIYHDHQRWRAALQTLEICADMLEPSWFVGDYNSPWANDARMQMGLINLLYLDDYATSAAHFEQYLRDFPASLDADDAAWHLVELQRLTGPQTRYQRALRDFIDDYADSRHARTARERISGGRP